MTLFEVNEAAAIIYDMVDPNANLIFGTVIDPSFQDEVSITIIATGFGASEPEMKALANQSKTVVASRSIQQAPQAVVGSPLEAPVAAPIAAPVEEAAPTIGGIEIPSFLRRRRLQGK